MLIPPMQSVFDLLDLIPSHVYPPHSVRNIELQSLAVVSSIDQLSDKESDE